MTKTDLLRAILDNAAKAPSEVLAMTHEESRRRRESIRAAVAGGMSRAEAARRFGVSRATAYHCCVGLPWPAPAASGRPFRILADLLNTTRGFTEIARAHGVSKQRVGQICHQAREAGINVPPRKAGRGRKTDDTPE